MVGYRRGESGAHEIGLAVSREMRYARARARACIRPSPDIQEADAHSEGRQARAHSQGYLRSKSGSQGRRFERAVPGLHRQSSITENRESSRGEREERHDPQLRERHAWRPGCGRAEGEATDTPRSLPMLLSAPCCGRTLSSSFPLDGSCPSGTGPPKRPRSTRTPFRDMRAKADIGQTDGRCVGKDAASSGPRAATPPSHGLRAPPSCERKT